MKVKSFSHVRLLATPWTAAHQAPPSMGFSSQEYWSGCHCLLHKGTLAGVLPLGTANPFADLLRGWVGRTQELSHQGTQKLRSSLIVDVNEYLIGSKDQACV